MAEEKVSPKIKKAREEGVEEVFRIVQDHCTFLDALSTDAQGSLDQIKRRWADADLSLDNLKAVTAEVFVMLEKTYEKINIAIINNNSTVKGVKKTHHDTMSYW